MEARNEPLYYFLNKPQQFRIPIYQRKYSWNNKQCEQLLKDIIRVGKSTSKEKTHFIGSIVCLDMGKIFTTYQIIDGQQRITTLSLLIAAIAKFLYKNPQIETRSAPKKLVRYSLINNEEDGDLIFRLKLTEDDDKTFQKVVNNCLDEDDIKFDKDDSIHIVENYEFFRNKINKDNVNDILEGFNNLLIINIKLKEGEDNPQLIFESLNATGLKLNQADLIRNFILMKFSPDEQEELYNKYWHVIEKNFEDKKGTNSDDAFDLFIRDYLTLENGEYPKLIGDDIYIQFKKYAERFDPKELIETVFINSEYYLKFAFNTEPDKELNEAFISLNKMEHKVVRPFLLALYRDYAKEKFEKEEFIKILNLTESFLIRRYICGFGTNSLNGIFPKLYQEMMNKINEEDLSYFEAYKLVLVLKRGNSVMPKDEEFKRDLKKFNKIKHRGYILDKLENYGYKETTDLTEYTIEHIMPQKLSEQWKKDLGPNYELTHINYLNILGNITLTKYNSYMKNDPFPVKKEKGYIPSNLRLNAYLCKFDHWNEETILERNDVLADRAVEIWEYPVVLADLINKYSNIERISEENNLDHILYWDKLNSKASFPTDLKISDNPLVYMPIENIKIKDAHIVFRRLRQSDEVKCELFLEQDKDLFNFLYYQREEIESKCNYRFNWLSEPSRKSSKIEAVYSVNVDEVKNWDIAIDWQLKIAEMFYSVFPKYIRKFYEN